MIQGCAPEMLAQPDGWVTLELSTWTRVVRCRTERAVPVQDVAAEMGLVQVHSPHACIGRGCSIHHPSEHHMREWPRVWRSWHGYIERTCPHGIGHPDPDDVAYIASTGLDDETTVGVHGCDGCCQTAADRMARRRAVVAAARAQVAAMPPEVRAQLSADYDEANARAAAIVRRGQYLRPPGT